MRQAFRVLCSIGGSLALVGCDSHTNAPTAPTTNALHDASHAQGAPGPEYVNTPAGWYHRTCVHGLPAGARVNPRSNLVTRGDGSQYQVAACTHAAFPTFGHTSSELGHATAASQTPTITGWLEYASTTNSSPFHTLNATWKVPAEPVSTYDTTKVLYQFPALEPLNGSSIVQPVMQYGRGADSAGAYWSGAGWYCGPSTCYYGAPIRLTPGDSIYGNVSATACISGECTFVTTIVDVTQDTRSGVGVIDTDDYAWAFGGSLEVYGINSCDDFPVGGTKFTGISVYTAAGQVTPSFSGTFQTSPSPSCAFAVNYGTDTVHTVANPPGFAPTISIDGPTRIQPGATCIWSASVSGGTAPFTYDWHINGTDMGSGDSFESAKPAGMFSPFTVYLDVWDNNGFARSTSISVTETSSAPFCPN